MNEIDPIMGNLRFAITQAGAGGTVTLTAETAGKLLAEVDRLHGVNGGIRSMHASEVDGLRADVEARDELLAEIADMLPERARPEPREHREIIADLKAELDRLRAIEAVRVEAVGAILAKHAAAVGTVGPMPKPTADAAKHPDADCPDPCPYCAAWRAESPGREDERAEAVRRAFESALVDDPTMLSRAWQAVTFAADVTRETYPSSPARRRLVEDELRRAPADRTPLFWPAAAMGEGLGPEPGILAPAATAPAPGKTSPVHPLEWTCSKCGQRAVGLGARQSRELGCVRCGHADVVISRAILERLTKAAASDPNAREARWAAERILQQATLAAEPARTDPEAARARRPAVVVPSGAARPRSWDEPIPDSIGPRGSSYDGAHAPARVLCPTCERWHFPTDCCQA